MTHQPTTEQRAQVERMAALGVRYDDIAATLDINDDTLKKYYFKELRTGRLNANQQIAKSLFDKARKGDTTSMIFWLKTRAGWKETQTMEHTTAEGSALSIKFVDAPPQETREAWEARVKLTLEGKSSDGK